jgi:hypothetical protein
MPQSPESFTDDALYELIDSTNRDTLEQMEAERIEELARDILWAAIEEHDLPIIICRYDESKDELIERLTDTIIEGDHFAGQTFDTPAERYNTALEIAEGYWDSEETVLERLVVCIEQQLIEQPADPSEPQPDGSSRKKRFMADLIADDNMTETYHTLVDIVLHGDPLDLNNDSDIDICIAAIQALEDIDNTPRRQLYYQLRSILGVPFDGLLPGTKYSEAEQATFLQCNDAAEELHKAAAYYTGAKYIGARHETISEIMAEFSLTDPELRQKIFDATDTYGE